MHDTCMATKTISLELDAYERLRRARRGARESFSSVVRRARWDEEPLTGARLLERMAELARRPGRLPDESTLDRIEAAGKRKRRSPSRWPS